MVALLRAVDVVDRWTGCRIPGLCRAYYWLFERAYYRSRS